MPVLPAQPHKQLSTIPSEEPSSVSEPVNGCPAIREPLLVRETCLEDWEIFISRSTSLHSTPLFRLFIYLFIYFSALKKKLHLLTMSLG